MIKIDISGTRDFVARNQYSEYVRKALSAFDTLEAENGAGNDFLGWKHLPSEVLSGDIPSQIDSVVSLWKSKGVDLVIAIGIGGSYLGAKCVIEALSHNFAREIGPKDAPQVVFAGNNLSEDYIAELMDLAQVRNVACIVIPRAAPPRNPQLPSALSKNI